MVDTRDLAFDRVGVDFLARGGARVWWRLARRFLDRDPGPYTFRVQAGEAGLDSDDGWEPVGGPVDDACELVDSTRRGFGRRSPTHYRVLVDTPLGRRRSRPAATTGVLAHHDWPIAREVVRQHRLRLAKAAGVEGWLFRRRWSGETPDPTSTRTGVVDPITGAVVRPGSDATAGTPYLGGYFGPSRFRVDPTPGSARDRLDPSRGSVDDESASVRALVVAIPPLLTEDLFVADGSDLRYYVQRRDVAAAWRGVPLIQSVELRPAPAGDPAYGLAVPGRFE